MNLKNNIFIALIPLLIVAYIVYDDWMKAEKEANKLEYKQDIIDCDPNNFRKDFKPIMTFSQWERMKEREKKK